MTQPPTDGADADDPSGGKRPPADPDPDISDHGKEPFYLVRALLVTMPLAILVGTVVAPPDPFSQLFLIGATLVFLIAKTALGEPLRRRASGWIKRMEDGFQEDALSYLLVLRLVPIFPFWLVNIVPAFLGMRLVSYVVATFLGILPGTAVIASIGNGVGEILEAGERPDLSIVFAPEVLGALVALAALVLSTTLYKRWRRRRDAT